MSLPANSSPRPPRASSERREGGLDEPAPAAVLERHAHRHDGHAAGGDVDLLGQVGERVGKRVVDGPTHRLRDVDAGEIAIARVRRREHQRPVEHRHRQRHRLEQRIEASVLLLGGGEGGHAGRRAGVARGENG